MKIQKLFVTVSALSILMLFTACAIEQTSTTTKQNNNAQTSASLSITDGNQQTSPTLSPGKAQSGADLAAYNGAMQLKDATFCDKIVDTAYQAQCKTDIADAAAINEAVTRLDDSLCDKLSTKDQQEVCKIQIQVQQKNKELLQSNNEEIKKGTDLMSQILKSQDYSRCQELTIVNQRKDCEVNILANKAVREKDVKICDNTSIDEVKTLCQEAYKRFSANF